MQIEEVINKLNKKYYFKILAFLILSFPTYQNYGQLQSILVAVITPNYTCHYQSPGSNVSFSKDQCYASINGSLQKCQIWNFSREPVGKTMMSDYGLVCDKRSFGDYILIVWYTTAFTGILMGWLSDRYGRKNVAILNLTIETVSSILIAMAPNVASNMVFRFFLGISASSIYITFVWLMESVNGEFREFVGSFFWLFGCLAYMVFPLIVYATKNWRYTQLVSIIPSVIYLFIFFIPESPRWLFVIGKRQGAFISMKTICKINKLNIDFERIDIEATEETRKNDLSSALRSPVYIFRAGITFLLQFSVFLFYLGVTVNISLLSKNVLLSIFLLGIMEAPGLILSFLCLHYLRRKHSLLIFGFLGSSLFWISVFFHRVIFWQSIVRIVLGCIAKAIIASVNQTTMVYVAELFPTSHRSFGFVCIQLANFLSFVGAIYVNKFSHFYFFLPMTIYLIIMWISCILVFCLLPETKGLPFPETLEDQTHLIIGKEDEFRSYMKNKRIYESDPQYAQIDDSNENSSLINSSKM